MNNPAVLEQLISALRCLPGVGPKSSTRMAYHLLQRDREGAQKLAASLQQALDKLAHCDYCNNFSEHSACSLCQDSQRDKSILCVVEMPTDLMMLENTRSYQGQYFVLMGKLSPMDGIGPKDIHLDTLLKRAQDPAIHEVIVATNFTSEGEATAHYIGQMLKSRGIQVSRIARGLPMGGEIEYVDSGTLSTALLERKAVT
ncbi:recombination mediator RecR [Methylophilus medardicus]|uniref:Recombination protein RecR n=1 Tax=Methylophilus medardicus TaxID=2588534 RepID=A0A5B8CRZ8_9PROT|nr:recombination mediator RecR [Methylophilus medardicus]QDC44053.1 recombination protein RecR [Methylophilus medardicus]QDC49060.1 recombination protein RecR [Methylophilus medardicus]QDC52765.1 recombination protein RecR [Methylophilus medardicus]